MATYAPLCRAIIAILSADTTIRSLCARTTLLVVARDTAGPANALPVLCYQVRSIASGQADVLITGVAASDATARALTEQAKVALTQSAFATQGLQVMVFDGADEDVDEVGNIADRFGLEGSPNVQQADWALPLIVVD